MKDVNLYFTTVIHGLTMEEATYSNFSLSKLRIINHNRSPKAYLNFVVRIGIATPKKGAKSKAAKLQAREEASRRAKATSMFLRVYGLQTEDMTITTADQKPRKGVSPRRVEVVLQ